MLSLTEPEVSELMKVGDWSPWTDCISGHPQLQTFYRHTHPRPTKSLKVSGTFAGVDGAMLAGTTLDELVEISVPRIHARKLMNCIAEFKTAGVPIAMFTGSSPS